MPVVPRIERSIETQDIPNVRINPAIPAAAFGGLNRSMSELEKVASEHYEKEKKEIDLASVLDADLKLSEFSNKIENEAMQQYKGKDALFAIDHVRAAWEKTIPEIEKGLGNDDQKSAYRNRVTNHWINTNDKIQNYIASETDRYKDDTTKASSILANSYNWSVVIFCISGKPNTLL